MAVAALGRGEESVMDDGTLCEMAIDAEWRRDMDAQAADVAFWALGMIGLVVTYGMLLANKALDACYFASGQDFEGPGCGCPEMPAYVSEQVEWSGHAIVAAALNPVRR